ncbi:SpoIIE family protein phosphatase [Streptomyces sp. NPDC052023]|uniref:SpoIIE family protein phosphatase n=1 Tax=Streptomyces sp. NPDC052023 TaxID=3365681 RepID=UPI0037CDA52F
MDTAAQTATSQDQTARRTAFQAAETAMALLDASGTVVGWTQAAERLVGHTAAEVVGRSAASLLPDAAGRAVAAALTVDRAPSGWSGHTEVRHRDGRWIDARLWVQSLSGHDGGARWIVSATGRATLPPWVADGTAADALPAALRLPGHLPVGVVIRDTELRCTWVNDTQGERDGLPLEQRLGRRLTEASPSPQAETLEALMRQVLESGVPATNVEFRAFAPASARREPTFLASFFRLDDAQARALGVCVVTVDVSESRRARERLAVLSEASRRIGTTLDIMRTGQELADLAVPLLADYATVDLAESVPWGEEPPARPGAQGGCVPAFRRAGLASVRRGAPESLFGRGEPVLVPTTSPFTGVLHSGTSHFEPLLDASPGTWIDVQDTRRARTVRDHAMHSLMIVPIRARGAVLGVALFLRTENPLPFEEDDLLLAEELVSRAALSLDNARRYARERSAALALQRHLLPHHATGGTAAEVAWRYLPADSHHGVGGDWFDVIPLSGARVALVVGDVVGHGINAAATMGQLRTAVRTLANLDLPPDELLARLDDTVTGLSAGASVPEPARTTMTATCLYAVYDPITRQCTMARAGHPAPAIIDPDGGVTFPDLPTGAPLGVGMVPFASATEELPEGSTLALYTDGLVETHDHDIGVGMCRLSTALARPGLPLDELCSTTVDALSAEAPRDDVTLLLARTHALGPSQVVSWELAPEPSAAGSARALASAQLARWGLEDQIPVTELIVSELVTNAIRHGTGPFRLRLVRHESLTCEVHDTSGCAPRRRQARSTDEGGRGLLIVDQLSSRWGTRYTADGKIIWTEQHLAPANGSG